MERGSKVVAEVAEKLTGWRIFEFIRRAVKIEDAELMMDEFHAYHEIGPQMKHHIINYQEQYIDGDKHANAIEGSGRSWSVCSMDSITTTLPVSHLSMLQNGAMSTTIDTLRKVSFGSFSRNL